MKKLIEVALPLQEINAASAREKSIRHGHPSTLHLWWARRPLATARAVIWSSLVDDPSSHPEEFSTEEAQRAERERLFDILRKLVVWENSGNEEVLKAAKAEIMKSTNHHPPALLDPFAGGGAIPLEAQRLGLKAYAGDLNPVAVMINKAMIEIPPRFAERTAVNPDVPQIRRGGPWTGVSGLADDVRYYGEWMREEAFRRIGHLYPKVKVPKEQGGGEATVIAWIWARTVKCPNPACGCEMPLASSFILSKKKGKEAFIQPKIENGTIQYEVKYGQNAPEPAKIARGKFRCVCCNAPVPSEYIKGEGKKGRIGNALMAVVAESAKGRLYITADHEQAQIAECAKPNWQPCGKLFGKSADQLPLYGFSEFSELFTNRQLTALTTFCDLVDEARERVEADAIAAGLPDDRIPLSEGGTGARAYSEAVGVYLAFVIDKMADYHSSVCSWNAPRENIRGTFGRQAIPMVWDYAEANPFCGSSGSYSNMLAWVCQCIANLPAACSAHARQLDAQSDGGLRDIMVSTDPPYYDNIGYADLSDFFYIWMRRSLKSTYPELFRTMLVPKAEELVATPYRFEGSEEKARDFFEDGMLQSCRQIYRYAREDIPVTIYYAYKQSDTDGDGPETQRVSTGWETILSAIVRAGFAITGTWPMRTERPGRSVEIGTNALASSIVLVCRRRPADAPRISRRDLVNLLRRELRPALRKLQASNLAPVDLAQSAIGPGMGVFSRYSQVLEADGTPMPVRDALKIINAEIDLYFNEQVSDMDPASRFCVDLYTQYAFNHIRFGDAEVLATAKGASILMMTADGILYAKAGIAHLVDRADLANVRIDPHTKCIWTLTQQLTQAMETGGMNACAQILTEVLDSKGERAKDLAYRLYTIAERKNWANEAYAYNALVVSWPDIQAKAAALKAGESVQLDIFMAEPPEG